MSLIKEQRGILEVDLYSDHMLSDDVSETIGFAIGPCKNCEEITEGDYKAGNEDDWWCAQCWDVEDRRRDKQRIIELKAEVENLKEYLSSSSRREGKTIEELDWYRWYRGGDSGLSSETIFQVMTGIPVKWTSTPMDSGDFGRCSRLLDRFPKWRDRLGEVSEQFPEWKLLIDNWSKLELLYEKNKHNEVYELIKVCCEKKKYDEVYELIKVCREQRKNK